MPHPPTAIIPVTEILHGETITDPYRWLEDGESPETVAWTLAQNRHTEAWLAASPHRERIRRRLGELLRIGALGAPTPAGGRYFYQRREGTQDQPVLYVREGLAGEDRVLIDPVEVDTAGTTALDWYFPSDDGRLLAYGLSTNGSEESVLHLLEVATGKLLADRIPGTRATEVAWLPDSSGFYYARYPAPGTVPDDETQYHRAIYFHRLGAEPAGDPLIFQPARKEHWPGVDLSRDGRWLVISVARTFDHTDVYLQDLASGGPLVPVVRDLSHAFDVQVAANRLYIRTNLRSPEYAVFVADPGRPAPEHWTEIVPARAGAVLDGLQVTRGRLVLSYVERAASRLRLADLDGRHIREVPLPAIGSVFGWGAEPDGDELFYGFSSYTIPPSVYRVDLTSGDQRLWRRVEADIRPERFEVGQVSFPSKDGTTISMFLIHPQNLARDGQAPAYLTGYGGFNISMTPGFSRSLLLWLEQGGVVAIPNLRGGGEYGEAWHQGGMLGKKQNTFDDFIAAAEWLIRERYTSSDRLAIAGGSNGGLLAGAVLTQRPDLFRAAVIQVPLLDMLRYHRFRIARLWIPEYGSAEDPEEFRWLRAYSPYHHVRDGVPYPAVLLATAETDTRVDPLHARKMTARLQAASSSEHPVLLRLEPRAGHGAGKPVSKVLEELTDTWTFVTEAVGLACGSPAA